MATDLKLYFTGAGDRKINFSLPYADASATAADVKALMQGMITNGDIYSDAPLAIVKAEFVGRTVKPVTLP